jgi:uncharacterized protein
LKRDHGWLSLIALDWLKEGKNEIPSIGFVTITKGAVEVKLLANVNGTVDGKQFTSGNIRTDADSAGPEKVQIGSKAFIVIKRGDRFAIRMWDSEAETRKHFTGIDRFPVNPQWRIDATWRQYDKPKMVKIASVIPGFVEESPVPGVAIFKVNDVEYKLEPIAETDSEEYFFLIADKTSGKETYPAGRFLYADPPKDGKIILDFNMAYNPPCAFTPFATCPLPPASNKLNCRIEAGEKKFGDHSLY